MNNASEPWSTPRLMALGSSAPEILLSVIETWRMQVDGCPAKGSHRVHLAMYGGCLRSQEIMSNEMYIGDLGSGTVVGHDGALLWLHV